MKIDIDKLAEILFEYFGFDDSDGTYFYILTRVKESKWVGTMTINDFHEIDEELVYELAEYILNKIDKEKNNA